MKAAKVHIAKDEELVILSAQGNRAAFEELYNRYGDRIYGYFLKMNRNDSPLAKDLTQDLFLKLIHHAKSFDASKSFKTWIFSVANNMCKNNYRHAEVANRAEAEISYNLKAVYVKPSSNYDKAVFKDSLDLALEKLDEQKRTAFILRFKQNLSIKEISAITETSEGTVKSRLFYTLRELAEALREFKPGK